MTKEIAEHMRKLSSRSGRYWLRDSRNSEGVAEQTSAGALPFESVSNAAKQTHMSKRSIAHESVVVSIPNVAAAAQAPVANKPAANSTQPSSGPPAPHSFTRTRLKTEMPELAPVTTSQMTTAATAVAATVAPKLVAATAVPEALQPNVASAALVEASPPGPIPVKTEPKVPASKPAEDDAVKAARSTQSTAMESAVTKIADEIVDNFPLASASVIMMTGSQSSLQTDETCARVAAELANRNLGRVLLIDSDFEGRRLTKAGGMSSQGGLSEVMNIALPWQRAVLKSGSSKLDFMAAGTCPHKRWTPKRLLKEAIAEIRGEYQFVCVSAGDAHGSAAALWSELSDGVLLVVSASQSSDAIAQSAVGVLKAKGARILGCVVADARVETE